MIKKWAKAWKHAEHYGAKLCIIKNVDDLDRPIKIVKSHPYYQILRRNDGMDIGAFKDFVRIFATQCDLLAWFTDDCLPMNKHFLKPFLERLSDPKAGLVGSYFQKYKVNCDQADHVRTVGFMIRSHLARRLKFPLEIKTKDDCYAFEYGDYNMTRQVQQMGYEALPIYKLEQYKHKWTWDCTDAWSQEMWPAFEAQFKDEPARIPDIKLPERLGRYTEEECYRMMEMSSNRDIATVGIGDGIAQTCMVQLCRSLHIFDKNPTALLKIRDRLKPHEGKVVLHSQDMKDARNYVKVLCFDIMLLHNTGLQNVYERLNLNHFLKMDGVLLIDTHHGLAALEDEIRRYFHIEKLKSLMVLKRINTPL